MSTDDAITTATYAQSPLAEEDDWDVVPPRRTTPWVTRILAVGAVAVAAFAGGIFAQKEWGDTGTTAGGGGNGGNFAALRAARGTPGATTGNGAAPTTGGAGPTTTGGFGSRGTIGQVSYIKGTTLYVTGTDGNVVQVKTSSASTVTKTVKTSVNSINPGDTVVVQGATAADGSVTATSVTIGGLTGNGLFGNG